jgi:hypothetical protein
MKPVYSQVPDNRPVTELERGADSSADLTERAKLRNRPGKLARTLLHLVPDRRGDGFGYSSSI